MIVKRNSSILGSLKLVLITHNSLFLHTEAVSIQQQDVGCSFIFCHVSFQVSLYRINFQSGLFLSKI